MIKFLKALAVVSLLLAVMLGLPWGCWALVRPETFWQRAVTVLVSLPWVSLVAAFLVALIGALREDKSPAPAPSQPEKLNDALDTILNETAEEMLNISREIRSKTKNKGGKS